MVCVGYRSSPYREPIMAIKRLRGSLNAYLGVSTIPSFYLVFGDLWNTNREGVHIVALHGGSLHLRRDKMLSYLGLHVKNAVSHHLLMKLLSVVVYVVGDGSKVVCHGYR